MTDPLIHPESTDWTPEEVDAFREGLLTDQHVESPGKQPTKDAAKQGASDVTQKTQEAADSASSKADELTSRAQDKAGRGHDRG
jgi:hypothetical protein